MLFSFSRRSSSSIPHSRSFAQYKNHNAMVVMGPLCLVSKGSHHHHSIMFFYIEQRGNFAAFWLYLTVSCRGRGDIGWMMNMSLLPGKTRQETWPDELNLHYCTVTLIESCKFERTNFQPCILTLCSIRAGPFFSFSWLLSNRGTRAPLDWLFPGQHLFPFPRNCYPCIPLHNVTVPVW